MVARTHGMSKTYIYQTWVNMIQRCHNPNIPNWGNYGGRGISVCQEWRESFETFLSDVGHRPSEFHSLDRIDNDKGYSPDNCRWVTQKVQSRNTRITRWVDIDGERYKAADLAETFGLKIDTIVERAGKGFSFTQVTGKERIGDLTSGIRKAVIARSKKFREATHCQKGHEFTPENTRLTKERWKRCKECSRLKGIKERAAKDRTEYRRQWRSKRKAAGLPVT